MSFFEFGFSMFLERFDFCLHGLFRNSDQEVQTMRGKFDLCGLFARLRGAVLPAVAAALVLSSALPGWPAETADRPVVRLAGGDFGAPNPFRHYNRGPGIFKMELVYDSLLQHDEKGLIPWLAESWEVSGDGKVLKFRLTQGARWHDGRPVTADDVLFTFDYCSRHKPVRDHLSYRGKNLIAKAEAEGQNVTVVLTEPVVTALERIGNVRILPKHVWEKVEDPLAYDGEGWLVGCGPFRLDRYEPVGGAYRMVAVDGYWGPRPAVSALEWVPIANGPLAFDKGELDLLVLSPTMVEQYEKRPDCKILSVYGMHCYHLLMNPERVAPLAERAVRQAVLTGIDREKMIRWLEKGHGLPTELEITKIKNDAKEELSREVKSLAADLAEKIIKEKVDDTQEISLIDKFIAEVGEDKCN